MNETSRHFPIPRRIGRALIPRAVRPSLERLAGVATRAARAACWSVLTRRGRVALVERRLQLERSSWLFIVGVTNSGTTILARLLEQHAEIHGLPKEGQFLTRALPRPDDFGDGRLWAIHPQRYRWTETDDPAPARRSMFDWSWHYAAGPGIHLEKSPPNLLRMRWLQAHFVPARFIVLTRNPYAVCEGIRRRRPDCTIEQAAQQWVRAHEIMFEDLPHIEHVERLTYETVCAEPLQALRTLEQFLRLRKPFDDSVVQQAFEFRDDEYSGARLTDFNEQAVNRLEPGEIDRITAIARPMMEQLGYAPIERSADRMS